MYKNRLANIYLKMAKDCIKQMQSIGLSSFLAQGHWATWNGSVIRNKRIIRCHKLKEDPIVKGVFINFQGKTWEFQVLDYAYLKLVGNKRPLALGNGHWQWSYKADVDDGEDEVIQDEIINGSHKVILYGNDDVQVCEDVCSPDWKYFKSGFVIKHGGFKAFHEEVERLESYSD